MMFVWSGQIGGSVVSDANSGDWSAWVGEGGKWCLAASQDPTSQIFEIWQVLQNISIREFEGNYALLVLCHLTSNHERPEQCLDWSLWFVVHHFELAFCTFTMSRYYSGLSVAQYKTRRVVSSRLLPCLALPFATVAPTPCLVARQSSDAPHFNATLLP